MTTPPFEDLVQADAPLVPTDLAGSEEGDPTAAEAPDGVWFGQAAWGVRSGQQYESGAMSTWDAA
jgi:hypothetical protein